MVIAFLSRDNLIGKTMMNQWISADPCCSRGSASEEKLPAARVRSKKQRWSFGSASQPLDRSGPVPSFRLLQGGPLTGAVQDESQMQDDASKVEAGSAARQVK